MFEVVHESLTVDDMVAGREASFPFPIGGSMTDSRREALVFAGVLALEHASRIGLPIAECGPIDGPRIANGYTFTKPGEWIVWYTVREVAAQSLGKG